LGDTLPLGDYEDDKDLCANSDDGQLSSEVVSQTTGEGSDAGSIAKEPTRIMNLRRRLDRIQNTKEKLMQGWGLMPDHRQLAAVECEGKILAEIDHWERTGEFFNKSPSVPQVSPIREAKILKMRNREKAARMHPPVQAFVPAYLPIMVQQATGSCVMWTPAMVPHSAIQFSTC
jgi:hypothetical protein